MKHWPSFFSHNLIQIRLNILDPLKTDDVILKNCKQLHQKLVLIYIIYRRIPDFIIQQTKLKHDTLSLCQVFVPILTPKMLQQAWESPDQLRSKRSRWEVHVMKSTRNKPIIPKVTHKRPSSGSAAYEVDLISGQSIECGLWIVLQTS